MRIAVQKFVKRAFFLSLAGAVPADQATAADLPLACRFETLCTGTEACEPAPADAMVRLRRAADGAGLEMVIEDDALAVVHVSEPGSEPFTAIGAEPGKGGAVMLSVFEDGSAALTMHITLFGPLVVTGHGRCEADK